MSPLLRQIVANAGREDELGPRGDGARGTHAEVVAEHDVAAARGVGPGLQSGAGTARLNYDRGVGGTSGRGDAERGVLLGRNGEPAEFLIILYYDTQSRATRVGGGRMRDIRFRGCNGDVVPYLVPVRRVAVPDLNLFSFSAAGWNAGYE
jgi:hypothetical protein